MGLVKICAGYTDEAIIVAWDVDAGRGMIGRSP